jgi:hypothetical protein
MGEYYLSSVLCKKKHIKYVLKKFGLQHRDGWRKQGMRIGT